MRNPLDEHVYRPYRMYPMRWLGQLDVMHAVIKVGRFDNRIRRHRKVLFGYAVHNDVR